MDPQLFLLLLFSGKGSTGQKGDPRNWGRKSPKDFLYYLDFFSATVRCDEIVRSCMYGLLGFLILNFGEFFPRPLYSGKWTRETLRRGKGREGRRKGTDHSRFRRRQRGKSGFVFLTLLCSRAAGGRSLNAEEKERKGPFPMPQSVH